MSRSSRRADRRSGLEEPFVAYPGPHNVEPAAGQGDGSLLVGLAFGSFGVVEDPRSRAGANTDHGPQVHHAQQGALEAPRAAQVAADAAEIAWGGTHASEAGQPVGGAEGVHVAAG